MNKARSFVSFVVFAGLAYSVALPAQAEEPSGTAPGTGAQATIAAPPAAPDPDPWTFVVAPYAWLTAVNGNTTVKGFKAPVDASIGDVLSNLNIAAMGQFEVSKGKFGAFVNPVYASLDSTNTAGPFQIGQLNVGPIDVDGSLDLFVADVAGYYRALELDLESATGNAGSKLIVEPYLGARVWNLQGDIKIPVAGRTFKASGNKTWADAIIGFRSQWEITDRWNLSLFADIGTGASDLTTQGVAFAGYRFDMFAERDANVIVGYRALYDDYSTGSGNDTFAYNATIHGPLLGLAVTF